jgi:ACS family hexuronate transporter-like MFS transporter
VRYRWLVCLLLFLATTINYVDRQILALVKPILDDQLGWTNAEYGRVNAAFQGAYALGLLFFGFFVDRVGTKIGYALSIAGWSLSAIAHSLVGGVGGFLRARVALGFSEGGNFPSAVKAVAVWFPRRERAFATALFNSGANVGAVVAPAVVPFIALTWDWRAAFVAAGCAGLLWLVLWLPLYDGPEKAGRLTADDLARIRDDEQTADAGAPIGWRALLRQRRAWSFIAGKALTDPVWWFFLIWLPDFFKKTRHLDIKGSRVYLVSIYGIVTVLSIAGGWLAGALVRRGLTPTRARKVTMLVCALAVVPIIAVTHVGTWTAVVLIGVAGSAHQAWSANLFTTVSDMFPKRAVATLVGVGGMAGSITGIAFPIVVGTLLDRFQAAGNVTAGYAILFLVCGLAYLLAFAVGQLLAPSFEPAPIGGGPVGHKRG